MEAEQKKLKRKYSNSQGGEELIKRKKRYSRGANPRSKRKGQKVPSQKPKNLLESSNSHAPLAITKKIFQQKTLQVMQQFLEILHLRSATNSQLFVEKIFEKVATYNRYRKQATFKHIISCLRLTQEKAIVSSAYHLILKELQQFIDGEYQGYKLSEGNILMSLPGGKLQAWHTDYDQHHGLSHEPLVFFIGLSNCHLGFETCGTTKTLHLGDTLLFRGYAVHRGCTYKEVNFRIHFYAIHAEDEIKLKEIESTTTIITNSRSCDRTANFS